MHRKNSYLNLEELSWENVRRNFTSHHMKMPLSVHAPLNPPFARKLVYCDCAMNAYVLDMPSLDSKDMRDRLIRNLQKLQIVSFAFGAAPFVPEPALVEMSRQDDGTPIISAQLAIRFLRYINEYCVSPDGMLHIRCTVINECNENKQANIWCRLAFPLESEVFDYHYTPFKWNASRWQKRNPVEFQNNEFLTSSGCAGKVVPGDFTAKWIDKADFSTEDCNYDRSLAAPYYIHPEMQIKELTSSLHLSKELEPGESCSFELLFDSSCVVASPENKAASLSFDAAVQSCTKKRNEIFADKAEIFTGCERENAAINAITMCNLQLLIDDGRFLRPCQGGSSERFHVWVWEAMESLRPMLRLGFYDAVKGALEFIFTLQDSIYAPDGNFSSLEGCIGNTALRWACSTGAALVLAVEYIHYSGDRDFLAKYLPQMLAAGRWIINEIRATRIPGSPYYGVMPECRATDGDFGRLYVFTDSWLLAGLKKLSKLLKAEKHPDFQEFDNEAQAYQKDFDAVMDSVSHPNGYIESSIGDDSKKAFGFRNLNTAMYSYSAGVSPISEERMLKFLRYLEENVFSGLFCSAMSHDCYYVGNSEITAMKAYLELGEWKKAWAASMTFRRYTTTPDLFLTQERYSSSDVTFTPWQPNASNNGRYLDLQLSRMWFETTEQIILLGAYAPFELESESPIGFKRLKTCFGLTEFCYKDGICSIKSENSIPAGTRFVLPKMEYICQEESMHLKIKYL